MRVLWPITTALRAFAGWLAIDGPASGGIFGVIVDRKNLFHLSDIAKGESLPGQSILKKPGWEASGGRLPTGCFACTNASHRFGMKARFHVSPSREVGRKRRTQAARPACWRRPLGTSARRILGLTGSDGRAQESPEHAPSRFTLRLRRAFPPRLAPALL